MRCDLLAVVEALRAWRCYLYGSAHPIEIFTDHHSLQYINTQPNLSARQCRWVELLQDYTFKIRHIAGDRNVVADALSRRSDHELAHVQENEARLRAGLKGASGTGLPRLQLEVAAVRTRSSSSSTKTRPSPEVVTGPVVSTSTEVSRSSVVAPSLMFIIGRAAETDVSYQELVARHEHYGLIVQDGLVYSTSGLLYIPQDSELRTTLVRVCTTMPATTSAPVCVRGSVISAASLVLSRSSWAVIRCNISTPRPICQCDSAGG
jgi:hypothetical protein